MSDINMNYTTATVFIDGKEYFFEPKLKQETPSISLTEVCDVIDDDEIHNHECYDFERIF